MRAVSQNKLEKCGSGLQTLDKRKIKKTTFGPQGRSYRERVQTKTGVVVALGALRDGEKGVIGGEIPPSFHFGRRKGRHRSAPGCIPPQPANAGNNEELGLLFNW